MGIALSRFYTSWCDWLLLKEKEVEPAATFINPISSGNGKKMLRSISLVGGNESVFETIEKPDDDDVTKELKVSISFKKNGVETEIKTTSATISVTGLFDDTGCDNVEMQSVPSNLSKMKLRRSFGSGRRVVVMGSQWWKLLESAELERSTMTSNSSESAKSKWYRAKVKAVRVGKGLSKNAVFLKLASQHWPEAVDPGHRYGHNLRYYYVLWRNSSSREPFFHWLNHGEGKDLNLDEICSRRELHKQRVKYLSPVEREEYEVLLEDGNFKYKKSNQLIDTSGDGKWIFVLSTSGTLYVGKKKKGSFHHSSFLAGGAISAAGRVLVENGVLKVYPLDQLDKFQDHMLITCKALADRRSRDRVDITGQLKRTSSTLFPSLQMSSLDDAEAQPKADMRRNWSGEDLSNLVLGADQKVKILNRTLSKTIRIRSLPRRLSVIIIPEKHHPFRSLSAPVCRCTAFAQM